MQLHEFFISRSSARQRAGRAGRTGPGVCYRLYSEEDYYEMMEYSIPEILRGNLDDTVLLIHLLHSLKIVSVGSIEEFPLLDCPSSLTIRHAEKRLENYGALNHAHEITSLGVLLSSLPLPVAQGYFLVMAAFLGQPYLGVIVCSTLSFQVFFCCLS